MVREYLKWPYIDLYLASSSWTYGESHNILIESAINC